MRTELATLRERTTDYALNIVHVYCELPKTDPAHVLGRQLLRSGTSVGAHYREAFRAKSTADFVCKLQGGLQELEESDYWLDLLARAKIVSAERLRPLVAETQELLAIFTASAKRAKGRHE